MCICFVKVIGKLASGFAVLLHSLSTADVTEQAFCMYEVPWFCPSVLCVQGFTTYQGILLCEMLYFVLYINFYFVLEGASKKNTAQYYRTNVCED